MTLVRGRVVMRDGVVECEPGWGRAGAATDAGSPRRATWTAARRPSPTPANWSRAGGDGRAGLTAIDEAEPVRVRRAFRGGPRGPATTGGPRARAVCRPTWRCCRPDWAVAVPGLVPGQSTKPCPILGVSEPGSPRIPALGADLDIRTDLPRYQLWQRWRGGRRNPTNLLDRLGGPDWVAVALGCSYSFDDALAAKRGCRCAT